MKLIAEQNKLVEMFTTMQMSGLFNPVVLTVKKDVVLMTGRDTSDITLTSQKFKGITIEDEDNINIVFDTEETITALKLFKSNDEVSINILDNTIIISNADTAEINDVITMPQIDINTIDTPEFPFKIVKGLPVIKNKATGDQVEFNITATIQVKYLAEFIKRANFTGINPRIYKLIFDNNTLKAVVGKSNDFQKSIETTVSVTGDGTGELLFGAGLEELVATLSGDVVIHAFPGAPAWFVFKSDNNVVYMLIAPAVNPED